MKIDKYEKNILLFIISYSSYLFNLNKKNLENNKSSILNIFIPNNQLELIMME